VFPLIDVDEAAVEKGARVGKSRRAILQPIEQGCGVDPHERRSFRVEAEIGRAVSGGIPDAVDRLVEQTHCQWRVLRQ
jgi:hypothetical protein